MKQGSHIVFVTTSNFATNPRLVKEVDLALSLSHSVSIIAFSFDNWSAPLNEQLISKYRNRVHYVEIAAGRRPLFPWLFSSMLQKCCLLLAKAGVRYPFVLSQALQKRTVLLINALNKLRQPADLIVAHNPGSFYPVMRWAKRRKIPYGIDVEDYHPGETNDKTAAAWMRRLMVQTIPAATYITAAAPLILEYVKRDCGKPFPPAAVVLNYFPSDEFRPPVSTTADGPLRLVWFSQYIAAGRGLEIILAAIKQLSGVELHFYGQPDQNFVIQYLQGYDNVILHGPLPQLDLHKALARYDIGLALEDAGTNLNRNLCLTNKLLAFLQAGLFILATPTDAQIDFLSKFPDAGLLITKDEKSIHQQLLALIEKRQIIRKAALSRFLLSRVHTAESEVRQLQSFWDSFLR